MTSYRGKSQTDHVAASEERHRRNLPRALPRQFFLRNFVIRIEKHARHIQIIHCIIPITIFTVVLSAIYKGLRRSNWTETRLLNNETLLMKICAMI